MIDNYSIELFPDQNIFPYLHSIKIPYVSRWQIKIEEVYIHSKSLERPKYEDWIEILKLEISSEKDSMQKNIETYFKLDTIQQRILSTLENCLVNITYNLIDYAQHNSNYVYLYDLYKFNVNGEIFFGECKRILGGYYLQNILESNDMDEIESYFI